jgi:hypothetical protein
VPILFLSVPWAISPPEPDGSEPPQVTPARHDAINADLDAVVRRHPGKTAVLNIDPYVSPGNHYDMDVNGQECRYDDVHFAPYCARLLEPYVLSAVSELMTGKAGG